jgi:hypothetical protein
VPAGGGSPALLTLQSTAALHAAASTDFLADARLAAAELQLYMLLLGISARMAYLPLHGMLTGWGMRAIDALAQGQQLPLVSALNSFGWMGHASLWQRMPRATSSSMAASCCAALQCTGGSSTHAHTHAHTHTHTHTHTHARARAHAHKHSHRQPHPHTQPLCCTLLHKPPHPRAARELPWPERLL